MILIDIYEKDNSYFSASSSEVDEIRYLTSILPVKEFDKDSGAWKIPMIDLPAMIKDCNKFLLPFKVKHKKKILKRYKLSHSTNKRKLKIKNKQENLKGYDDIYDSMNILNHDLFPFQAIGSYFLLSDDSGLLCDNVGLGKTIQSLVVAETRMNKGHCDITLIVCPSTLKKNWAEEIEKFTDSNYVMVDGSSSSRKLQYRRCKKYRYVVVNYDIFWRDEDFIQQYMINRGLSVQLIIDEAQYIKNRKPKRSKAVRKIGLQCDYRIGLSATLIENKITDLFSICCVINESIFGGDSQFNNFFRTYCDTDYFGKVIGYKHTDELKERLKPHFIRRFKEDVLDELPDVIENNYWVPLSKIQREFYNKIKNRIVDEIADMEKAKKIKVATILPLITYLRQCVVSSALVGHSENISTKEDELLKILEDVIGEKDKVIIFCHFVEMVEILYDDLNNAGYKTMGMHGGTSKRLGVGKNERVEKIKEWDNDNSYKILVASDILREGVNILSANYLVNMDLLFNPALMVQRVGRFDRIGNKHKVINVINIIAEDTIEDSIFDILFRKKLMSSDILDDGKTENRLTIRNIKEILSFKNKVKK